MKYYETSFEEYLHASRNLPLHPELDFVYEQLPQNIKDFKNIILYGPSGVGKYTQALKIIEKYSNSHLKYDKKMSVSSDKVEKKAKVVVVTNEKNPKKKEKEKLSLSNNKKQEFVYRISDIHYEIDMSLLGCNSKNIWHELFFQIMDIISVKPNKVGIILCKNFHFIYNELLDIFYSYMKHPLENYKIFFILITEHIGFIPNRILNSSQIIPVTRPEQEKYISIVEKQKKTILMVPYTVQNKISNELLKNIDFSTIVNLKELYALPKITNIQELPNDIGYNITHGIIDIMKKKTIPLNELRNQIYDLLVYNIDVSEWFTYIVFHFIEFHPLPQPDVSDILRYTYTFLKYYNNNYRSIYHLENFILFMIHKIHYTEGKEQKNR